MRFDGTVTLGNVLTILAFAMTALAFGLRTDFNIKAIQKWIKAHAECNATQIAALNEIRTGLSYLRGIADAQKLSPPLPHEYRKGPK